MIYLFVTGSRDWDKPKVILSDLNHELEVAGPEDLILITGFCKTGADSIAIGWAVRNELPHLNWPARWKSEYYRSAGPRRNKHMGEWLYLLRENLEPMEDNKFKAYAYPKGESRGTRGMMKILSEKNILCIPREYEDV